ncbi:helix-turn-helix transcriptional regulator [Methylovorus glucosotrophus]|uniref:Uncharacterized protein n=1 Tax=Methylovorus glucosotrophus (strain SIP3-4) TaxID=582744 RepID=C6X803_METGS|nr:hypothetical protein [Methylovorus glucosotrophus]ACT51330.1 hypothetical protein Msip34_2088 [Methylovorus glucosotrophus SIP3-4]
MTPNDFLGQLNQLPPDTPITAQHLIAILSILANDTIKDAEEKPYSSLDREDVITEEVLAKWINKNVQTLRNWRGEGKGPKFIKDSRSVNYRVGTVMDWLKSREVQSTTQADTLKFGSTEYDSVFPSIYLNHIATPFFDTIRENEDDYLEMNITGYQTLWTEKDSIASLYLSSHELNIEVDKIIEELLRLKVNGTDLNKLETILINNQAHSINLTHLIALNTYDYDQYTILVKELYSNGLDFHTIDSSGKTSIQLAEENDNMHLCSMISSFDLYNKLQKELN